MNDDHTRSPQSSDATVIPIGTTQRATQRPTLGTVLRNQRRAVAVSGILIAASLWIFVPMGEWQVGVFVGVGMLLGLANHVATELSLGRMISSGAQMSRSEIATSALVRLLLVSVPAVAVAVAFWPVGLTALIGLALFRLITLVMTGIPLLKELKA